MSWLTFFYEEPVTIHLGSWVTLGDLQINYGLLLDSLSMVVMVPVGIVTLCVLFYAVDYMSHDPNRNRFYIILSVFAIFMTILVVSENYVMMFIGWEFVGVISYLLISFWSTRIQAMKSALSALLLNRMGDTLFVIAIGCMISYFHAVDFATIELISPHVDTTLLNLLAIMLLIAATAKSAQLGLHGWLLSAMEGWFGPSLNFTICWNLPYKLYKSENILSFITKDYSLNNSGIILYKGQSAGNLLKGSSETIREIYDNNFIYWFRGFTEGDGSFIINKFNDKRNKPGSLEFKITQSTNDEQVLYFIKKQLGFGSVRIQDKNNKTSCYRVRDKDNLLKIINIFNGNIYLPRYQNRFKLFIERYNEYYNTNIEYKESLFKPTLNDGWLSGFTDAEGCFTISYKENVNSNINIISLRFILSQKTDKYIAEELAILINGKISYLKDYDGYNITTTRTKMYNLINYLQKYNLRTKKHIDYKNFYNIYKLLINKVHFTLKGDLIIKRLIDKFNKTKRNH
ncbi:putative intron-encoded DNA endonuclease; homing endonuclease; LAGLIDADG domain (mitochondrion) [Diutina catenulata]